MMKISDDLKAKWPDVCLGVVKACVQVEIEAPELWEEINQYTSTIKDRYSLDTLTSVPEIKALREAYRAFGKDSSRYRGSAEALTRRVLQGKGLYRINNVVDVNNLVSLKSRHSVGTYDIDKVKFPVEFRIGRTGESYKGIGKETIDICGLPVFADTEEPYGSPTSDSEKAMIQLGTKNIMMVVISFAGDAGLNEHMNEAKRLLTRYASATNITTFHL